jgi:hypothetical protein
MAVLASVVMATGLRGDSSHVENGGKRSRQVAASGAADFTPSEIRLMHGKPARETGSAMCSRLADLTPLADLAAVRIRLFVNPDYFVLSAVGWGMLIGGFQPFLPARGPPSV